MKPGMATSKKDSRPVNGRHTMSTGEILEQLQGDLPRQGKRFTWTVLLTDHREDVLALRKTERHQRHLI